MSPLDVVLLAGVFWRGDKLQETIEFKVNRPISDLSMQVNFIGRGDGAYLLCFKVQDKVKGVDVVNVGFRSVDRD